jgi:lipopolysaccharide biosynthesis glycosyltransferase
MQEEKVVVYSGTRNLYEHMETACKSLVANSQVDRVILLLEDDKFPYEVPSFVETKNVSKQGYFAPDGANWNTPYTYMSLMRVTYSKLFPELPKILQLDVDTIVTDDLSPLWDLDLTGCYFAAVEEKLGTWGPKDFGMDKYYNIGVAMFNLDEIREDGVDDDLIRYLNKKRFKYIDQDAWNFVGEAKCMGLSARYNEAFCTGYTDNPAVVHYASGNIRTWWDDMRIPRLEYYKHYKEMSWADAIWERKSLYSSKMERPLHGWE